MFRGTEKTICPACGKMTFLAPGICIICGEVLIKTGTPLVPSNPQPDITVNETTMTVRYYEGELVAA